MSEIRRIVLDKDGKWWKEHVTMHEINPVDALERHFTNRATVTKVPNMYTVPGFGNVGGFFEDNQGAINNWFSIHLESIHFRCGWKTIGEGEDAIMHPDPVKTDSRMSIEWKISDAFSKCTDKTYPDIVLMINVQPGGGKTWSSGAQYLFAVHPNGNTYRMPLSNLYDNCGLCSGEYDGKSGTLYGALEKSLFQFRNSQWNADLFKSVEMLERFVRVKPLKDGFQTMPYTNTTSPGSWIELCMKVSTPMSKYII